jgi:hypothetical protein
MTTPEEIALADETLIERHSASDLWPIRSVNAGVHASGRRPPRPRQR